MNKQVLQLCHDYRGPFVSICRQYVAALSDADVTTVFIQGAESEQVIAAVGGHKVLFLEKPGENLRGFKFAQIFRLLKSVGEFDAVIAHRYKAIYLAGMLSYFRSLPKMLGITHEHRVFKRVTRKLFVTFWRRNFVVAGVSKSVVDDIARSCPSLLTENRLIQIPNVLDVAAQEQQLSFGAARDAFDVDRQSFVVGTIGRLVEKKSMDVLIKGFARLDDPSALLVIIGDGPLRSNLQDLALQLGIEHRVRFLGHVENASQYARLFNLFVLSSGSAEAFGLVLLEAMAGEVPVLSSTAPGPAEVVNDPDSQFIEGDPDSLATKIKEVQARAQHELHRQTQRNRQRVQDNYSVDQLRRTLNAALGW